VDHDHEVVGGADEFHDRTASAAMLDAAPWRSERLSLDVEVLIENGQGDVSQQRGQESGKDGALLRRPPLRTGLEPPTTPS
jgi:hypothetical protein